jgi:hypothetical protein
VTPLSCGNAPVTNRRRPRREHGGARSNLGENHVRGDASPAQEGEPYPPIGTKGAERALHMLERERRLVLQEEVAAACSRTRGAVAPHLRSLEQKGLLCRPAGERQGYAPTPRGERCR